MGPTFFGLTPEYKLEIHKLLFAMAYNSNGAFNFEQLYNMPIYLRTFYVKQLEEIKVKEAEAVKSVQRNNKSQKR